MRERDCLGEELELLGLVLGRLPMPMPAAALVSRVRRFAHLELAEQAAARSVRRA